MPIYYFSQNSFVMKHYGENEIPNFVLKNPFFFKENPIFFLENPISFENPIFLIENPNFFLSQIQFFSLENPNLFRKHTKFGGLSLYKYYFSKTYEIRCLVTFRVSLLHLYAARNIPSISDTMWCKAGFILRMP